ncbi:hypothetical protein A2U01_0073015, partial [Trifolium medium]|nr:hypothetical protein [Trifolium medium]
LNRHKFFSFCLWRGAQMHAAQRAVLAVKGNFLLVFARRAARAGATRSVLLLRQIFLLGLARRAAEAGAARSVALYFLFFFWLLRGARRWSARRACV